PKTDHIALDWSTATETNNAGFHLQRSENGLDFFNIQWIPGNGTTNALSQYAYLDHAVEKEVTYYYRLHQIDFDGSSHFSDVVSAKIQSVGIQVSAWPNPFDGSTNIVLSLHDDSEVDAFIVNSLGQQVVQLHQGILEKGSHHWDFDLVKNNCRSGIYTLIVQSGDRSERFRLVAQ
ncbi:MAG: T9SS type A sorting domain-containing protein, partial [Bacteroidia bacterium]